MCDDKIQSVPRPENGLTRRQAIAAGAGLSASCVIGVGYDAGGRSGNGPPALRPPGALVGNDFLSECIRCGDCIDICPNTVLGLRFRSFARDESRDSGGIHHLTVLENAGRSGWIGLRSVPLTP